MVETKTRSYVEKRPLATTLSLFFLTTTETETVTKINIENTSSDAVQTTPSVG